MIFLGAGASKIFGIKTLQEMSMDLVKIMEKKGYGAIVGKITENLQRFGITPDFEAIYTIVEGLTNLRQAVRNSGSLTAYVSKDIEEVKPKRDLKELPQLFRDFLYEECKLKPGYHESIESVYDRLFEIMKNSGVHEKRYIAGVEPGKEPSIGADLTIVTTNYDMIIESYHMMKGQPYADGFKQTLERPLLKEIDLTTYSYARRRWLIKLHGCIWQYRYNDNVFKTNEDPKKISSFPVKIQEQMMIYPTGEKPILQYPYYDFYNIFKTQKWHKLIAIGYSFRDDPVNIAILENLERVEHSNLIVVNPEPEKAVKNLEVSAKSNYRIIPVEGEFGNEEVFKKLEVALKVKSKNRYNVRLAELHD